jgi:uncharacterized protein (TIGR02246 family)
MYKTLILVCVLAAVLASTAAAQQKPNKTTPAGSTNPTEEQAIRLLGDGFVKAYNAGDAKGVAALFAADGEIVNEAGESVHGQPSIEQVFGEIFQAHPKAKMTVSNLTGRLLNPTTAVEDGTSTVTLPSGQTIEQNRYMVVYLKQNGTWRMATARDLPNPQASAAEKIKELEWLIGDWVDESPGTLISTSYSWADDGRSILGQFRIQVGGQPAMTGEQRIAWDPQAKKIHSWVHDSEGGFAEGLWTRDGDRWLMKMTGASHDGRMASSTNVINHVAKDRMTWQSRDRVIGDEIMPDIEPVVTVRKAPKPQ